MNRPTRLHARSRSLRRLYSRTEDHISSVLRNASQPAILAAWLIGCATPVVPAQNVVVDLDVARCSDEIPDTLGPLDVAIVIDTSQSTGRPTGFDIDGDGVIRPFQRNSALDRGDSRLAAQIAAVRPLLRNSNGRDIRFSLITYSGPSVGVTVGRTQLSGSVRDSKLRAPLTSDLWRLDDKLTEILDGGSDGRTIFSAGMRRGTRSLTASHLDTRRKIVLFMSDSRRPNALDSNDSIEALDPRMMSAAVIARRNDVVFHTFGLSPKAGSWRREPLGQIAGATGGTYHPIDDPGELYCHLADALSYSIRSGGSEQSDWQAAFARYRKQEAALSNTTGSPQESPAAD